MAAERARSSQLVFEFSLIRQESGEFFRTPRPAGCCARTLYHNYNRNTARKYPGSRNAGTCARIPASPNQSRLLCGMLRNDALKRGHPGQLVGAEGIRGTWPLGREMCRDIVPFLRAARRTGTFRNSMQSSVISCNTVRCMLVGSSLV